MQVVKASDYDLYTGSKRAHHATSDDSDFEETTPTDKGKKRLKLRDATPVDLPQMGNKRDGDTMMMKLGALEYCVGCVSPVHKDSRENLVIRRRKPLNLGMKINI